MNPNVAIELGYAIARLGDEHVLMILNTAFGNRAGLPFDIRHKGGPIMYELGEGASKPEIAAEKAKLVPSLVEALRPFVATGATPDAPAFKEHQPRIGSAFFFGDGQVLGRNKSDNIEWVMPFRSVFYLRVMPTRPLVRPLPLDLLLQNAGRFGAFGDGGAIVRENEYGVAVINPAGNTSNVDSLTQYFRSGEIWGINAYVLREGDQGDRKWLPSHGLEHYTAESLHFYLQFLQSVAGIDPPFTVEAGLHGIKGLNLVHSGFQIRNAKMSEDSWTFRRVLQNTDLATQDKYLLEYYERVHDLSGHARPDRLYGFPPNRS